MPCHSRPRSCTKSCCSHQRAPASGLGFADAESTKKGRGGPKHGENVEKTRCRNENIQLKTQQETSGFVASSNPLCLEIREEIIGDRWDNLQNFKKKRNPGTERMPCAACLKLACFGTRKIWGQNSPYHFAQQICFRFGAKMCEFSLHCVLIHDDSWIPAFELRKCIETYRDYI